MRPDRTADAALGPDAREEVLRRVRAALGPARGTPVEVPRGYRRRLAPDQAPGRADVVALFIERVAGHRVPVRHVVADELPTAIAAALWGREAKRIAVPADLPFGWLAELDGVRAVPDTAAGVGAAGFDALAVDGVVTGCAAAVAQTGTLVLDGGRGQGRRALALVPGHHVCVVHADQIVGTLAEAVARLDPARPLTWITGPTAPGGPGARALEVLVVDD
ncbi:LutC/YkgG family protein [Actinomadura hibisca]|uniref:LutC/YkgG family protein n=1 Tax=Actinomadura hibisca TaxID=68565 RepID=UPI001FE1AB11|nr:LUD domain-containing protein [Actinomadura hibisca]